MARLIEKPTKIEAASRPPKSIEEFVGRVNSGTSEVSIARMVNPRGWSEPGQRTEFDEYMIVLHGSLRVKLESGQFDVGAGPAIIVERGQWVQYSTPAEGGAEHIAVCRPAFSPATVHGDAGEPA